MLTINNINLKSHACRFGHVKNSSKPALLVLPGNLQEIESIQLLNNNLGPNYDYYVLELPGTGLTPPLHPKYTINDLSELLKIFCKEYVKRSFILIACSYATPIALEYSKNNPWVNQLILAGSMSEIPKENWGNVLGLMSDSLKNRDSFSENFINILSVNDPRIPRRRAACKASKMKAKNYTENQYWCFIYNSIRLLSYDPQNLHNIHCPTLCFTGELDPYVKKEWCEQLSNLIPNALFETIPNSDHLFMIEQPQKTIDVITSFIADNHTQKAHSA